MSGCMGGGEPPRIAILMAVYEPRLDWLREQLLSLNAQTYPNLMLYLRDDASPTVPYEDIRQCVEACITRFPYVLMRNEENVGSTLTFQRLTAEAEGTYLAYCDQDDVWLPEKLTVLEEAIRESGALVVCSDMQVIDGRGEQRAESIKQVRHRAQFLSGREAVFRRLLTRNFVMGCTMLICGESARAALPFLPEMVHDHWLALFASSRGDVLSLPRALIRYHIHGGNQTGILAGIGSKQEYVEQRILGLQKRLGEISRRVPEDEAIRGVKAWADARAAYAKRPSLKSAWSLWRKRKENTAATWFELTALRLPDGWFPAALKIARILG